MARRYARDNRGRFASKGTGATARGGRLKTAGGSKRQTQTMQASAAPRAGAIRGKVKRDPTAAGRVGQSAAAKPTSRKDQLAQGAQRRRSQADKIDARVASLENQYRSKGSAFYTQGVKTAERDRMHGKMQQAAKLREESAALRQKASNADRMASKIKAPAPTKSSNDPRMQRAIQNEAAGSTSFRRNPKGYQKRITALTAQKIYETGDVTAGLSVANMAGKGFRLPRSQRKPAAAAAAKPRLKRTGKTIKVARAKPPKPTKEDRAIEKVASLKAATKIGGRAKLTFVPDSALTPARRKALGLSAFASESGSQRYRVSRQTFGNERGVAISERSSYQARLPKTRQGVVRRRSPSSAKPAARAAAAAAKPPKGSQAATKIEQAKGRTAVLTQSKNALNQQLKSLNAQIKAAGPSAGGLRLQKLQIQDRLAQVRRDIAASKAAARG